MVFKSSYMFTFTCFFNGEKEDVVFVVAVVVNVGVVAAAVVVVA